MNGYKKILIGLITLTLTLSVGINSYTYLEKNQRATAITQFNEQAQIIQDAILVNNGIYDYSKALHNIAGLFSASVSVERQEFKNFISGSQFIETYPATQSFSFIKRVQKNEVEHFINSVRKDTSTIPDGFPAFTITPKEERDEYYVVTYVQPYEIDKGTLGTDALSNNAERVAIEKARDTGTFASTPVIKIGDMSYFYVFHPIYANNTPTNTVEERRENIIGVVAAHINLKALFDATINIDINNKQEIYVALYNAPDTSVESLLYESGSRPVDTSREILSRTFSINFDGLQFILKISSPIHYGSSPLAQHYPLATGVGTSLFVLLLGILLYQLVTSREQAVIKASELAKELIETEKHLIEMAPDIMITFDETGKLLSMNDTARRILDYTLEEVLGLHIVQLPIIASNSKEAFIQKVATTLQEKEVHPFEIELEKKSGTLIPAEVNISPIKQGGRITGTQVIIRDITERKAVERALKESMGQFKVVAENSPDGMAILEKGIMVYANKKLSLLMQYYQGELLNNNTLFLSLIAPESLSVATKIIEHIEQMGGESQEELTLFTKQRDRIFGLASLSRINFNNKVAILITIKDITSKKLSEQRATIEYALAKTIAESTGERGVTDLILENIGGALHWQFGDVWMIHEENELLYCNNTWHSTQGNYEAFEKVSRSIQFKKGEGLPGKVWATGVPQWIPEVASDDDFKRKNEAMACNLRTGVAFPLMVGKTIVGIVEFFTDTKIKELDKNLLSIFLGVGVQLGQFLKQRQTSEEIIKRNIELQKFQLAVEWTQDAVVITDTEGIIQYANHATERITEFTTKEIVGTKAGKLWGGLMPKEFYVTLWEKIKTEKKPFLGEMRNKRKKGDEYIAAVNISPVLDDDGNIKFFVAIERDITREKQIDRAKTEFVSLASHQLRTPLTAINWYTEMLMNGDVGPISEKQKMYLEEIYGGSHRLVLLVNSLLNVSRVELGTFVIEPQLSNVVELCEITVKEVSLIAKNKNISLNTHFANDIPLMNVDKELLQMIFQNIITNAVEYTNENGAVDVSLQKEGDDLLFTVKDTGVGIPTKDQNRIFEKMFRADNATVIKTYGTGLGLYIVKSVVEQMKGEIRFTSKENEGTTFFVTIPLSGMKLKSGTAKLQNIESAILK